MNEDLINRITYYLSSGGLFNPELADHLAVRNLLIECREALAQPERSWARLTLQEQIDICTNWDQSKGWGALYKAIDQALKEKNT